MLTGVTAAAEHRRLASILANVRNVVDAAMAGPSERSCHNRWMQTTSKRIIVTVIGEDRVGIIATVSTVLAEARANIIDISQTTLQEFFAMIMMADIDKAIVPFDEIKARLNAKGREIGVRIDAQHEDVFKYMHRV